MINVILALFSFSVLYAQNEKDSLQLQFGFRFGKKPLELNKDYISKNNDTLQISSFRFYVSDVQLQYEGQAWTKYKNSYHLIDIEKPTTWRFAVGRKENLKVTKIRFRIGVDSTANVSGAQSGDLDPAKGMYWAWQSGYINMKIEGKSASCHTRKNQFHFHIGGYLQPYYALRECTLKANDRLEIWVDLDELFSKVKLAETNSIMIPGKKAMELADISVRMFQSE